MKITRPTLNILLDELKKLPGAIEEVEKAAEDWSREQDNRDNGYGMDQYLTSIYRDRLEHQLIELRKILAHVYDTQGDKGLM